MGRLTLPMLTLVALLQRTPVLRALLASESSLVNAPLGQVLRSTALVATALGAVDTLAGATEFVGNPPSPASATVGQAFSAGFSVIGAPGTTASYTITDLPPGLSVPGASFDGVRYLLNGNFGTISGTPTQAGNYSVEVTAWEFSGGTGRNQNFFYEIIVAGDASAMPPSIVSAPAAQTVTEGGAVSFSVTASGTEPFSYQWLFNGSPILGANSSTYSITSASLGQAGTYSVQVSNAAGGPVTSDGASLTVTPLVIAPAITVSPVSQTVNVGDGVVFSVAASGSGPLQYQWFKGGTAITGANSSSYAINSATTADAGDYYATVTNTANSATSGTATLTVNRLVQSITFTGPPNQGFSHSAVTLSASATSGLSVSFVLVSGPATLSGSNLSLTGTGTVTVRAEQSGNSSYSPAQSVTRSFTVSANYAYWQFQNFSGSEITAATVTAPTYVYGADGIPNLVKYALGLAAKTDGTSGLPTQSVDATDWVLTYKRPAGQTDVTVSVEASSNLVNWSSTNVTLVRDSTVNSVESWRATVPRSVGSAIFLRLRVTR